MDTQHQQMCHTIGLQAMRARGNRQHTFYSHQQNTQQHTSRIDDFLICPSQRNPTQCEEQCQEVGGSLDHLMLTQYVSAQILPLTPAITKEQPSRNMDQLLLPIKKEYLTQVHATIAAELNTTFHTATMGISTLLEECKAQLQGTYTTANLNTLRESMPNRKEQVADMANTIMHQLRQALPILNRICPTKPPIAGHFLKRTTARDYSKMNQKVKDIKNLRRLTDHLTAETSTEELTATTEKLLDQHNWTAEATATLKEMPMDSTTLQLWREKMGTQIQETITRLEQVRKDQQKELKLKGQEAFRAKLSTQAKVVHRAIFNKTTEPSNPVAIKDQNNLLHTDTEGILTLLTDHMSGMMAPQGHTKTGNYHPETRDPTNRAGPWESEGPDNIKLETAGQAAQQTTELTPLVMEATTYQTCIKHLARNKQPGPDGIPNELLGALPTEWHNTIHQLSILMWILGETPACWKTSNTIMLYKKRRPHRPNQLQA